MVLGSFSNPVVVSTEISQPLSIVVHRSTSTCTHNSIVIGVIGTNFDASHMVRTFQVPILVLYFGPSRLLLAPMASERLSPWVIILPPERLESALGLGVDDFFCSFLNRSSFLQGGVVRPTPTQKGFWVSFVLVSKS